jgi:ATP-dependent DNA ligase
MNRFLFPNKPTRFHDIKFPETLKLEEWFAQPKWDGHRALILHDGRKIKIYSRQGSLLTLAKGRGWEPLIAYVLKDLRAPWLLDGEMLRDAKKIIVWDYAYIGGDQFTQLPYEARFMKLLRLVPAHGPLELIENFRGEQYREILRPPVDPNLEGFVLKRRNATNLWGLTSTSEVATQLKYRFR